MIDNSPTNRSFGEIFGEIKAGLAHVLRDDLSLARTELRETTGRLKRDAVGVGVFGVVALLGVPPFLAFLVIGLGTLLGGSYWLSALIVSLTLFAVGGGLAYWSLQKLTSQDVSFPHTRRVIEHEASALQRKLKELPDSARTGRAEIGPNLGEEPPTRRIA
jgi:hypothetical protein